VAWADFMPGCRMNLNHDLAQLDNASDRQPDELKYGLRRVGSRADFRDAYDRVGKVLFKAGVLEDSSAFYQNRRRISNWERYGPSWTGMIKPSDGVKMTTSPWGDEAMMKKNLEINSGVFYQAIRKNAARLLPLAGEAGPGKLGESGLKGFPQLPRNRAVGISTGRALLYLAEGEKDMASPKTASHNKYYVY
jgi:hypothetical protein